MKINSRSKEYPKDRNKYPVKPEPVVETITSLPLPEVVIPPLTPLILEEGEPPAVVTVCTEDHSEK